MTSSLVRWERQYFAVGVVLFKLCQAESRINTNFSADGDTWRTSRSILRPHVGFTDIIFKVDPEALTLCSPPKVDPQI